MFQYFRRWRDARILRRHRIPEKIWHEATREIAVLRRLDATQHKKLREYASLLLYEKEVVGAAGFEVDDYVRVSIAAQASLLVLNLDLDYYDNWHEILVYPDTFVVDRPQMDANGIVHEGRRVLSGEAWRHGPVILAWDEARPNNPPDRYGNNVVLHEFAHKVDMADGNANGAPPLRKGMSAEQWSSVFNKAFNELRQRLDSQQEPGINPYAATNPAEFFAVATESFFETPDELSWHYSGVYELLSSFYGYSNLSRRNSPTNSVIHI